MRFWHSDMMGVMNNQLEMRHLRLFLAVAETLHVGRAANKLGMAQPNLSQQIGRIERMVGHPLFKRHPKGVQLTLTGVFLQRRAASLEQNLSATIETARKIGRGEAGNLVIGFCGSAMMNRISTPIGDFRRAYPDVALELRELHVNQQRSQLAEGMLDICFMRDGEGMDGLSMKTLLREPYVAILSKQHPLAAEKRIRPESLAHEPFVFFPPTLAKLAYERTIDMCISHGFKPNIVQEAPQWTTMAMLIGAGLGVSLAPRSVAAIPVPGVVFIPVISQARTSIDAAFRSENSNASVKLLLSGVLRHMKTHDDEPSGVPLS
jgi:DNA-binding transcriptional LysR family regulator